MKEYNEIERIEALSNAFGVSGKEDAISDLLFSMNEDICDVHRDSLHNTFMMLKQDKIHETTILLDAHEDEVGFIIQAIKPNGTLRFLPIGGWDAKNIVASRVRIMNSKNEIVPGIVASKPVHFMNPSERNLPVDFDNLVIDIGASSAAEAKESYHIAIGNFVVPEACFEYHEQQGIMMGKAFDCRIGLAALVETMHRIAHSSIHHNVIGIGTAQEEVGDRGVEAAIHQVKGDIAICFEGCPADDTFEEPYMIQAAIKKGPMLRHFDKSMITHPAFQRFALNIAKTYAIPVQESVRKGGGTNGGVYHTAYAGIPTIVIGIPVRYAHAPWGIVAYEDYKHAVELAVKLIENITPEIIHHF